MSTDASHAEHPWGLGHVDEEGCCYSVHRGAWPAVAGHAIPGVGSSVCQTGSGHGEARAGQVFTSAGRWVPWAQQLALRHTCSAGELPEESQVLWWAVCGACCLVSSQTSQRQTKYILGMDLLKLYVLPHWGRRCRSDLPSYPQHTDTEPISPYIVSCPSIRQSTS